jgi:hypothetical protein
VLGVNPEGAPTQKPLQHGDLVDEVEFIPRAVSF